MPDLADLVGECSEPAEPAHDKRHGERMRELDRIDRVGVVVTLRPPRLRARVGRASVLAIVGWVGAAVAALYASPIMRRLCRASRAKGPIVRASRRRRRSWPSLVVLIARHVGHSAPGRGAARSRRVDRTLGLVFGLVRGLVLVAVALSPVSGPCRRAGSNIRAGSPPRPVDAAASSTAPERLRVAGAGARTALRRRPPPRIRAASSST